MAESEIIKALNDLDEIRLTIAELNAELSTRKTAAIPLDVRQHIDEIEAEFFPRLESAEHAASELDSQVRAAVLVHGSTVKAQTLMAVYAHGRVSWDNKALDGYLAAHPELAQFRREGDPSVSIRAIK